MLRLSSSIAALLVALGALIGSAQAQDIDRFIGDEPQIFATDTEAVDTFKRLMSAGDKDGLSKLLGLNLEEVAKTEDFDERFEEIRKASLERVAVENAGEKERKLVLGNLVWPFPFPIVNADGKWMFDTHAGLDEVIYRRIGENELETISNCHAYVDAQLEYASADRDGDGVLEFAQQILSDENAQNGLYWSEEKWGEPSPVASFVVELKALDPETRRIGYFGYKYKVLKGQGPGIAGGRYDYVINGNMIAGFALVAWPAEYGVTGVKTFVVNNYGVIYESDLGIETDAIATAMARFNPGKSWSITKD